jgi:prolyl oligopeptidase
VNTVKKWHDAGTKMQKTNVFDDFIAAAEYLSLKNIRRKLLAIRGGSNGFISRCNHDTATRINGLPAVGVMDMLRYHTFTAQEQVGLMITELHRQQRDV